MSVDQTNHNAAKAGVDISFVVACFNAGKFLEPAIRSALDQQGVTVEVLVIDDGSTDGSLEVAERLCRDDSRIVLLRTTKNCGPGGARNLGIDTMRGRWFAVLDADDLILPERSKTLLAFANSYHADMIADNLLEFGDGQISGPMFSIAPQGGAKRLYLEEYFERSRLFGREASPGYLKPMIRRQALELARLRYNPTLRISEDDDLVVRAMNANLKYVVCDYAGYRYRRHGGSISHRLSLANLDKMIEAEQGLSAALDPAIIRSRSYRGRWNSLQRGHAFTASIEALKSRSYLSAAMALVRCPTAIALYSMPLSARFRRLKARLNRLP